MIPGKTPQEMVESMTVVCEYADEGMELCSECADMTPHLWDAEGEEPCALVTEAKMVVVKIEKGGGGA